MKATSKILFSVALLALAASIYSQQSTGNQFMMLPDRTDQLPYSNAVLAGDTLYLAGSIGIDPETGVPPAEIEAEVRIVMDSIKRRLELAGMTMGDLVSVNVFCPDLSLYDEFNRVYRTYFPDGRYPARAFIGSGPLLRGGHFELTAIAVK